MQPLVQCGARLRQLAASDRRDDEGVLDDLALGVAAADADDIGQHWFEFADAGPVIATAKAFSARTIRGTTGPAANCPSAIRCSIRPRRCSSAA